MKTKLSEIFHAYICTSQVITKQAFKGVPVEVFDNFSKFVNNQWLAQRINLSTRTIRRYRKTGQTFNPIVGEHLLKIIWVFSEGEIIFNTVDEFSMWLAKPAFGTQIPPLDWLSTPGGCDYVYEQLEAIALGLPL